MKIPDRARKLRAMAALARRGSGILVMAVVLGLVGLDATRGDEAVLQNPLTALDKAESEGLLRLNQDYLKSVEGLLPAFVNRADLEGALAVQKEVERVKTRIKALEGNRAMTSPETLKAGPPALLELRAKFDERRKASLEKFYGIYYAKWAKQRDELTKEARLNEANQLQAALEQIEIRMKALTVLEDPKVAATTPGEAEAMKGAPDGAVAFGDHRYLYVRQQMSFPDAKEWCKKNGGNLVIIESREEDEFIGQLTNVEPIIIGAEWSASKKGFVWVNGKRMEYANLDDTTEVDSLELGYLMKNRVKAEAGPGGKWYRAHRNFLNAVGFVCEWD